MSISLLFVDDEPDVLEGLENRLHPSRRFWPARFASSGAEALAMLREAPADVVISDMRMPGMDGAQLLAQIRSEFPGTLRIILSGETGQDGLMRALACAHQVLAKPCDLDLLKDTVGQAMRLRGCLNDPALVAAISSLGPLPTLPDTSRRLQEALAGGEVDIEEIAALIEQDVALNARLIQLANSAYFQASPAVHHVRDAIMRLGLELVGSLVVTESLQAGDPRDAMHQAMQACQDEAVRIARLASELADSPSLKQTVFAVAMLRCVGRLALLTLEREMTADIHPVLLSGYLLSMWGFPLRMVAAVTFSHQPMLGNPGPDDPATVVHVASALQHHLEQDPQAPLPSEPQEIDSEWLNQCPGSTQTLRYWARVAQAFHREQSEQAA